MEVKPTLLKLLGTALLRRGPAACALDPLLCGRACRRADVSPNRSLRRRPPFLTDDGRFLLSVEVEHDASADSFKLGREVARDGEVEEEEEGEGKGV